MEPFRDCRRLHSHGDQISAARGDVDLLKNGRAHSEFERFAAAHADGLLRSSFLMCGDRGEAEELVQECLLRLARRWPSVRRMEHPAAYARRVLFNLALDGGAKRTRRRAELESIEAAIATHANGALEASSMEARTDLIHALGELPARQRAVLVLRYFVDLPESEVATILNCSPGTVKSSASRGLSRLRAMLEAPPAEIPHDVERPSMRRISP